MAELIKKEDHQPAVQNETASMIQMIERAACDPNVDIEKMERLWQMKERMDNRAAEVAFNAAMSEAQSEMGRVSADAMNPQTRSKYASYAALDKAIRPIYSKHGFSLSFDTGEHIESMVRVVCHVGHRLGHSRTYHVDMPADGLGAKGNAVMTKTHAAGSAMSYGMRYLLKLIFNVAVGEADDDGNGASEIDALYADKIDNAQVKELRDLLKKKNKHEDKLVQYLKGATQKMQIQSIVDIPSAYFDRVMKIVEGAK